MQQFWGLDHAYITLASGGDGNVYSNNAYTWAGGGNGAWSFWAAQQGTTIGPAAWQAAPYNQDAGSTFN